MIEVGFLYYCWQSRGGAGGGFDEADVLLTTEVGVGVGCVVVLCSGGAGSLAPASSILRTLEMKDKERYTDAV